jgi:hypothetical protein
MPPPVVLQSVVGVLESQLALAHTAHAGEIDPAPLRSQELSQALEFSGTAHEAVGAGGALREAVGGVALGELRFGWGRQVGVLVLIADHQIAFRGERSARDHRTVGAVGLVPRGGGWVGGLGTTAQQPQQCFPVLGLAEGIAGEGQASKGREAEGSVGLEPAGGHRPGVKALRGLWGGGCAPGLQLREEQAQGQRPPLPARPTTP